HESRESFFKYVEYTTSRFCHHNLTANNLKLITSIRGHAELDTINRCLELLLNKGVTQLLINITSSSESASALYRLPNILLSCPELKYLTIRCCELPSSLMAGAAKFKSLTRLELGHVRINDEVIKNITTSCPLLQIFHIDTCRGFKRFCVHGHQNLQSVSIEYNIPLERIDIAAPNLSNLFIINWNDRGAPLMNVASCKKLTNVAYVGLPLQNSNGFTDFLSKFPFIEKLCLVTNYECNKLKFSSTSLRALVLDSNCDLEEIEFSAPNLVSFSYSCDSDALVSIVMDKQWPLLRDSAQLKACMRCYPEGDIDALWFQKLRRFLNKKNGFKVLNLYIRAVNSQSFTELEKLKAVEVPPYELEHVELQLETDEEPLAHIAFVDAVLWCCRPRSLTLRSSSRLTNFQEQNDVVKFTYKKLLQQEDQGRTNIQIVSPSSSLLMALTGKGKAISFIKEEEDRIRQIL
ncbi:hypothetical protein M8C21_014476, partial [Ambrosia artemisiifolia]